LIGNTIKFWLQNLLINSNKYMASGSFVLFNGLSVWQKKRNEWIESHFLWAKESYCLLSSCFNSFFRYTYFESNSCLFTLANCWFVPISVSYIRITSRIVYRILKITRRSALSDIQGAYLFSVWNVFCKLLNRNGIYFKNMNEPVKSQSNRFTLTLLQTPECQQIY
jgi:hypothetical protein